MLKNNYNEKKSNNLENISIRSFDQIFQYLIKFAHINKTLKMSTLHEYNIELLFRCTAFFFCVNDNLCQVHHSI